MNPEYNEAIDLLKQMIRIPSFSQKEKEVADLIYSCFQKKGWNPQRIKNNTWVKSGKWDDHHPVCLLNSHIDTVQPAKSYTKDPFGAELEDGKLYGLGSNDAGASVVSLIAAFEVVQQLDLGYNLILLISAEEEISGKNGVELALSQIPRIDFGIVGEPTNKKMCIAEKGLMVLDGKSYGKSGHAARDNSINAIYEGLEDIRILKSFNFDKISPLLGKTKATVTQINAGSQHNVVPDTCNYVVDVRTNECYTNLEVAQLLNDLVKGDLKPRSTRLNSSKISITHPIVQAAKKLEIELVGSPTLSDQALMTFPTVKIGPGDSKRSHTADEYIYTDEIKNGIDTYIQILKEMKI